MQVLGALASVLIIWVVTGVLVYEAVLRAMNPQEVNGKGEPSLGRDEGQAGSRIKFV